jgi:hypothetical protein
LEQRVVSLEQERKAEGEKMRQLREKDHFLSLYLRYVMARDQLDSSITLDAARKALDDYIEGRVEHENVVIHKGQGRLAIAEFPDGTRWVIPPELSATSVPPR